MTGRAVLLLAVLVLAGPVSRSTLVRASGQALVGDAYVDYDETKETWVLGNAVMRYAVTRSPAAGLIASELAGADGVSWGVEGAADAGFTVNGRSITLGTAQVTRFYLIYPGAPAVETWLEFTATGSGSPTVAGIVVWRQGLPATDARWINGLQAPAGVGGPFARRSRTMASGQRVDLHADGRSSASTVPIVWLEGGPGQFVGGVMWSGAWSITAERQGRLTQTSLGLHGLSTGVAQDRAFETPHVFLGVTPGGLA
jgi:hypothetical protein